MAIIVGPTDGLLGTNTQVPHAKTRRPDTNTMQLEQTLWVAVTRTNRPPRDSQGRLTQRMININQTLLIDPHPLS